MGSRRRWLEHTGLDTALAVLSVLAIIGVVFILCCRVWYCCRSLVVTSVLHAAVLVLITLLRREQTAKGDTLKMRSSSTKPRY